MEEEDGLENTIDEDHCLEIKHLSAHHPREERHLDLNI